MIFVESSVITAGIDAWPEKSTSSGSAPRRSASSARRPTASAPPSSSAGMPSRSARASTDDPRRRTAATTTAAEQADDDPDREIAHVHAVVEREVRHDEPLGVEPAPAAEADEHDIADRSCDEPGKQHR